MFFSSDQLRIMDETCTMIYLYEPVDMDSVPDPSSSSLLPLSTLKAMPRIADNDTNGAVVFPSLLSRC